MGQTYNVKEKLMGCSHRTACQALTADCASAGLPWQPRMCP